jgi:hypothetical protein
MLADVAPSRRGPSGLTDVLAAAVLARVYGVRPAPSPPGSRRSGRCGAVVDRVDGVTYVNDPRRPTHAADAARRSRRIDEGDVDGGG